MPFFVLLHALLVRAGFVLIPKGDTFLVIASQPLSPLFFALHSAILRIQLHYSKNSIRIHLGLFNLQLFSHIMNTRQTQFKQQNKNKGKLTHT